MSTNDPTKIDTSTWSDADRAAYEAATLEETDAENRRALFEKEEEARKLSPAYLIAQAKDAAALARELRQEAEFAKLGEEELAKAQALHGREKVEMLMTLRGPIVMRAAKLAELDIQENRVAELNSVDRTKAWREYTRTLILFPKLDVFDSIVEEFPGTWGVIGALRDVLSDSTRSLARKKA